MPFFWTRDLNSLTARNKRGRRPCPLYAPGSVWRALGLPHHQGAVLERPEYGMKSVGLHGARCVQGRARRLRPLQSLHIGRTASSTPDSDRIADWCRIWPPGIVRASALHYSGRNHWCVGVLYRHPRSLGKGSRFGRKGFSGAPSRPPHYHLPKRAPLNGAAALTGGPCREPGSSGHADLGQIARAYTSSLYTSCQPQNREPQHMGSCRAVNLPCRARDSRELRALSTATGNATRLPRALGAAQFHPTKTGTSRILPTKRGYGHQDGLRSA